jgi:hydroxypyruvate isomerase
MKKNALSALDPVLSRRGLLTAAAVAAWVTGINRTSTADEADAEPNDTNADEASFRIRQGRIKQSVMGWCFKPMPIDDLIHACRTIGLVAIEGIDAAYYPAAREAGLQISLVSSHGFAKGPFSRDNHRFCVEKLREAIDRAVEFQCPNVITFTGMRESGISDAQGAKNCVECWKQIIDHAEKKGVNLCLEHLNTRDATHPMKGHPGYFGDDVELCVDLIKQVDSSRMKLLFDIYHVQIMHGDVIRRIRQYKDLIGHYHTAGVPGRGELDNQQEIQYPAVLRAILETGYQGFVAQEFIPTWPDKVAALRHAARVCDV